MRRRLASLIILALLVGAVPRAFARGGTGAANAQYKKTDSVKGLCTSDNADEPYYKQGYCLSLAEQLGKTKCSRDALEELRQRALPEQDRSEAGKKMKDIDKTFNLPFECASKDNKKGNTDIFKDPKKFAYVMMQFMAMTTVQESGWDVLNKEQSGPKGPGGLLNLSLEKDGVKDMDNKDYKCGCKDEVVTTSGQSGVTAPGQSPGPLDGHHSETCGSYMVLKHALKDGTLYAGNSKTKDPDDPKKDSRKGATKLFASLETEITTGEQVDVKQKWRDDKMKTFCERYWASGDSKTNPWERQLQEDVGLGTESAR